MIYYGNKRVSEAYNGNKFITELYSGNSPIISLTSNTEILPVSSNYFSVTKNDMAQLISKYPYLGNTFNNNTPVYHLQIIDEAFPVPPSSSSPDSWYNYEALITFNQYAKFFSCYIGRDNIYLDSTAGRTAKPTNLAYLKIYRIRDNKLLLEIDVKRRGVVSRRNNTYGYLYKSATGEIDDYFTSGSSYYEPGKVLNFNYNATTKKMEIISDSQMVGESETFEFEPLRVTFSALVGGWRRDPTHREGWYIVPREETQFIFGYEPSYK